MHGSSFGRGRAAGLGTFEESAADAAAGDPRRTPPPGFGESRTRAFGHVERAQTATDSAGIGDDTVKPCYQASVATGRGSFGIRARSRPHEVRWRQGLGHGRVLLRGFGHDRTEHLRGRSRVEAAWSNVAHGTRPPVESCYEASVMIARSSFGSEEGLRPYEVT